MSEYSVLVRVQDDWLASLVKTQSALQYCTCRELHNLPGSGMKLHAACFESPHRAVDTQELECCMCFNICIQSASMVLHRITYNPLNPLSDRGPSRHERISKEVQAVVRPLSKYGQRGQRGPRLRFQNAGLCPGCGGSETQQIRAQPFLVARPWDRRSWSFGAPPLAGSTTHQASVIRSTASLAYESFRVPTQGAQTLSWSGDSRCESTLAPTIDLKRAVRPLCTIRPVNAVPEDSPLILDPTSPLDNRSVGASMPPIRWTLTKPTCRCPIKRA